MEPLNNRLCLTRIRENYDSLSLTERKVADFVLQAWEELLNLSVAEVSQRADVSQATIVRFCKSLGFKGYAEFKVYLQRESLDPLNEEIEINSTDSLATWSQKVALYNKMVMDDAMSTLDFLQIQRAVETLEGAHRIVILSEGGSAIAARAAYDTFLQLGLLCTMESDAFHQVLQADSLRPGDVAFLVAHSGRSKNMVDVAQLSRQTGATTIALVGGARTKLGKHTDIAIYTGHTKHPYFSDTIAARICELNVVSILHTAMMMRKQGVSISEQQDHTSSLYARRRV